MDLTNIKISYSIQNKNIYESLDNRITFNNEINYIIGTKNFFKSINETFFSNYIKNNICIIENIEERGIYHYLSKKNYGKNF